MIVPVVSLLVNFITTLLLFLVSIGNLATTRFYTSFHMMKASTSSCASTWNSSRSIFLRGKLTISCTWWHGMFSGSFHQWKWATGRMVGPGLLFLDIRSLEFLWGHRQHYRSLQWPQDWLHLGYVRFSSVVQLFIHASGVLTFMSSLP